jgi:hypothetical protein
VSARRDNRTGRATRLTGGRRIRIGGAVSAVVGVALGVGIGAWGGSASASNSGQTLHFFETSTTSTWTNASGQPIPGGPSQSNPPSPGDQNELTHLEFVGNHTHHAKHWTASDHVLCVINSQGNAVCQAQLALDGSMVLGKGTLNGSSSTQILTVTGGTGTFQGVVSGSIVDAAYSPKSNDDDVTITLHR